MIFGKKRDWQEQYDEDYAARSDRREKLRGPTLWIHLISFGLVIGMMLGLVGLVGGQAMFEKTLTLLAAPIGVVWLLLIVLAYFSLLFRQGWSALLAIACWLILTLFGNGYIANQLVLGLERPYLQTTFAQLEKMDVVFLLGGGTTTNLQGAPQSSAAGDRVVTAARLYHSGKVDLIVCTGVQLFRTDESDLHPNEEAAMLLSELQVPESAVVKIKGANTSEEMQIAATFLRQQDLTDASVGIITSAWHLNRAGRLARDNGLNPFLIPSDFRSSYFTTGPNLLIPAADALGDSARCCKEYLARLVGR